MMDMLSIDPMLQRIGILGKGLDLVMQHSNGHPLALFIFFLGGRWRPLLLFLWRHNLDLLRCSMNTIYGHMWRDRLVLSTGDIPELVGLHPYQCLVQLGR